MPPEPDAGPIGNAIVAVLLWLFRHGAELVPVVIGLCVVVALACSALLWFKEGARYLWAWRQWRPLFGPSGGAGGRSSEYDAFMASAEWRRQQQRVMRREGRRCQVCGGRAESVHHTFYAVPISATPDGALLAVCDDCHHTIHARKRSAA